MSHQRFQSDPALRRFAESLAPYDDDHNTGNLRSALSWNRRSALWSPESWLGGPLSTERRAKKGEAALLRRGERSSGFRIADGGIIGTDGRENSNERLRFDLKVTPGGYLWWYVDALSDDGVYGLTLIAFVGSVFSPYYAFSGRHSPDNHTSVNVALYGPRGRWSMTERGIEKTTRDQVSFVVGSNAIRRRPNELSISIDDIAAPIPLKMKGNIRVHFDNIGETTYIIDRHGNHLWTPLAPTTRVEVDFSHPNVQWSGDGYLDTNQGTTPLEQEFLYWDWSRTPIGDGKTVILYNTDFWDGDQLSAGYIIDRNGETEDITPSVNAPLPSTPIWRIARRTRQMTGPQARVVKTFEDTPFYSRSLVETSLLGARHRGFHETFSGPRLRNPVVKSLLPFRMPRLA